MSLSIRQLEAINRRLDAELEADLPELVQPLNIIDFASNKLFLRKHLFPVQGTALKVATLATDLLTPFDHKVINQWQSGFELTYNGDTATWQGTEGTPGDLLPRMEWCLTEKRIMFREILLLIGRRGSKGYLGGILGAWQLWNLLALGDPHTVHGTDADKRLTMLAFAGKKDQAVKNQFRDLKTTIMGAKCFKVFYPHATNDRILMFTRAQVARGDHKLGHEAALIEIRASESTELGARGPAVPMLLFDEFAHLRGAGPTADSVALYDAAVPATEQFGSKATILQTTSPWDRQGQSFKTYTQGCAHDPVAGSALNPDVLILQLPSWALYEHHDEAEQVAMWPDGPTFPAGRKPPITFNERLARQEAANPDTFAVEFRAQWRSSRDAYFPSGFHRRVWGPYKGQPLTMQEGGPLGTIYVAHADPALSQANFGFAIAHREHDEDKIPHVVFDVLHHWAPRDFPEGVVSYVQIEDELYDYVKAFNLDTLTFDHWNSAGAIQRIKRRVVASGLPRRTKVRKIDPTATLNWDAYEVFKTAVGHGIIHAPAYELAEAEFRAVEVVNGKIQPAEAGETRTKDVLDAMVFAAYHLIGSGSQELFEMLSGLEPRQVPDQPSHHPPMSHQDEVFARFSARSRKNMHAAQRGFVGNNPARGGFSNRRPGRRR